METNLKKAHHEKPNYLSRKAKHGRISYAMLAMGTSSHGFDFDRTQIL